MIKKKQDLKGGVKNSRNNLEIKKKSCQNKYCRYNTEKEQTWKNYTIKFQTYYKPAVIKTAWCWWNNSYRN